MLRFYNGREFRENQTGIVVKVSGGHNDREGNLYLLVAPISHVDKEKYMMMMSGPQYLSDPYIVPAYDLDSEYTMVQTQEIWVDFPADKVAAQREQVSKAEAKYQLQRDAQAVTADPITGLQTYMYGNPGDLLTTTTGGSLTFTNITTGAPTTAATTTTTATVSAPWVGVTK